MVLDAASIEAITQEIRTCFLQEDAPDHLIALEQGIERLQSNELSLDEQQAEYAVLMRAAHSLKGGAGIAQLPTLNKVAHKLEDLIQALQQGCVSVPESAYQLLSLSIEQISDLIATSISSQEEVVTVVEGSKLLPTLNALDSFLQGLLSTDPNSNLASPSDQISKKEQEQYPITSTDDEEESGTTSQGIRSLNLRIPVVRLERMNNNISELFISYERLS